jgi:hypothetical protein
MGAEIHVRYTPWLAFINERYDYVEESCTLFELHVAQRLRQEWPGILVYVTRLEDGAIKDIQTSTKGHIDPPRQLTMASAAWQLVWDMIGPYSRHRVSRMEKYVAPVVVPTPIQPQRLMVAEELPDGTIHWSPVDDEKEASAIMRSGFGVARG